jgi:hypothetical protein
MEDLITYEIAKKLKEKGFSLNNEDVELIGCRFIFSDKCTIKRISTIGAYDKEYLGENIDCPTISQVLKWLRNNKKTMTSILPVAFNEKENKFTKYYCTIYYATEEFVFEIHERLETFETYEECALNAIKYVLDNLI